MLEKQRWVRHRMMTSMMSVTASRWKSQGNGLRPVRGDCDFNFRYAEFEEPVGHESRYLIRPENKDLKCKMLVPKVKIWVP